MLLLIPKIVTPLADLLSYTMEVSSVFGTDVTVSLQPLKSPLIPFLLASVYALYQARDFRFDVKPVLSKTLAVFLVLFPSLAITQLMLNSGQQMPSMIEVLAGIFEKAGKVYPVFSPFIGVLGAFISGSTTVSNIIFGSVQNTAALSLGMQPEIILSLQLAGASLGNAVCLFNIIAAAAVAGISDYSQILRKNLLPVFLACLICALLGYVLIWIV
jgi:lactate permease